MKWLSLCCIFFILLATSCAGALLYLSNHPWVDLTPIQTIRTDQPSIILDDQGIEWTRFQLEKLEPIPLSTIPQILIQAFLATEDRSFYHHSGISWHGIIRSCIHNIYYRRFAQGASTITQQLVRLLFFDTKKTLVRKIKEQFLALIVEQQFSKDQILEAYLNHVYFGCGIYGVSAAAQRFWGKEIQELTLDEAALLAGIVKSPRTYCPLLNPLNALQRRNVVLSCMHHAGYITQKEYDITSLLPVVISDKDATTCMAPHVRAMLRNQLEEQFGRQTLYTKGLIVKTTLNSDMQKIAVQAFRQQVETMRHSINKTIDGAIVTVEGSTGAIKVLVGGYDHSSSQFNRATHAYRQLGSVFKPLIYAVALEQGRLLSETEIDEPVSLIDHNKVWEPRNVTRRFDGQMTLAHALMYSNNIVSLKTLQKVHVETVINYARLSGITSSLYPYPSLALGCLDTTAWEAVGMFNTIVNQGIYVKPHLVSWIKTAQGAKIWSHRSEKQHVFSWSVSSMITHTLCSAFERLKKRYSSMPEFKTAACGKTGTTNDARNCWFVGATPSYTTAIYLGSDAHQPLHNAYATKTAFPLWLTINARIPQPIDHFSYDPCLTEVIVNSFTGIETVSSDSQGIRILIPA